MQKIIFKNTKFYFKKNDNYVCPLSRGGNTLTTLFESIHHTILFLVGRHLKIFTNSGNFEQIYLFKKNYKYLNLFAKEVPNA